MLQVEAAAQHTSISKTVVNAGAKSVSRVNAIIQKTSKAVKVGHASAGIMRYAYLQLQSQAASLPSCLSCALSCEHRNSIVLLCACTVS